jgi:hypothetical protein
MSNEIIPTGEHWIDYNLTSSRPLTKKDQDAEKTVILNNLHAYLVPPVIEKDELYSLVINLLQLKGNDLIFRLTVDIQAFTSRQIVNLVNKRTATIRIDEFLEGEGGGMISEAAMSVAHTPPAPPPPPPVLDNTSFSQYQYQFITITLPTISFGNSQGPSAKLGRLSGIKASK